MILLDSSGSPVLTMKEKSMTLHNRWQVFKGGSTEQCDMLYTVKRSSMIQRTTKLEVFLGQNNGEKTCDFRVKGTNWLERSSVVYAGESDVIVAQMQHKKHTRHTALSGKDSFSVTVNPNVDYAFIASLVVLFDVIDRQESAKGIGTDNFEAAHVVQGNLSQAAFWYGLVVHFRVYPIIYALPIILVLDSKLFRSGPKPSLEDWNSHTSSTEKKTFHFSVRSLFSRERIMFGLISGGVFLACNAVSFYFYGHEFLHEALLYHLTRTDPRHNFSIYFYHIYLHYERQFSAVEKLISFLPQFTVQLALVFSFSKDPVFCMFLQTVAFVAFNKVITAQYFVWFYCLLPLILPWSRMKLKWEGILCIILWIGAQTHWLLWGYMLEFKGVNVLLQLWMASLVFLAANTFVLVKIIQRHRFSPLFRQYGSSDGKNVKKLD
ncbi:unnamed protein product [Brassica oleracea]